jgi:hypothetical protein
MKSNAVGKNTSVTEVTNITSFGVWIIVNEREYFLSFIDFPWFKDAKIGAILDVVLLHSQHLHWPQLDIDIDVGTLGNLENYPLVFK